MIVLPGTEPVLQRTWYDEREAAQRAGVSTRTLRRWKSAGWLRAVKLQGRTHYQWSVVAEVAAAQEAVRTRDYSGGSRVAHHGRTPQTVLDAPRQTVQPACAHRGCRLLPGHDGDHQPRRADRVREERAQRRGRTT